MLIAVLFLASMSGALSVVCLGPVAGTAIAPLAASLAVAVFAVVHYLRKP